VTRKDKVFHYLDKEGLGLEIGPSINPIAPKKEGYRVHIIDHMSREGLVEKYKDHEVNLKKIEDVDFVWNGQPYAELTGKSKFYDWIIASHVVEHTPDLVGFLNDCESLLKDDGIFSLAVPDKRFCFDRFRPITGIARVIDSHVQKNVIHTPGVAAEYFLNVVSKGGRIAWDQHHRADYKFVHTVDHARAAIDQIRANGVYYDVHAWCFTPHSFRLLMHDLHSLGLTSLKEVGFFETAGCEFFISLSRSGEGVKLDRLQLLEKIEDDLAWERPRNDQVPEHQAPEPLTVACAPQGQPVREASRPVGEFPFALKARGEDVRVAAKSHRDTQWAAMLCSDRERAEGHDKQRSRYLCPPEPSRMSVKSSGIQSTEKSTQVCAVMVAYFPNTSMLRAALQALYAQVQAVLIVDNTPGRHDVCEAIAGLTVTVLAPGRNRGVAGGQNVGARWARARGFTHVLLMDQDSVVAPDLVTRLLAAEISLNAEGKAVAAVAPRFLNVRRLQAAPHAVAQGWCASEVVETGAGGKCQQLDYVISSGSLIELKKLEIVGEMEEALFIDYVDIEWGLRARAKGYHCYGVYEAHIEHCLGDTDVAVPWMKKRRVIVHSPLRHYYYFRNAIHLYKRSYASWAWTLNDASRLVLKYVFYSTITAPRRQHLRMMTLGIWHGLRGRLGPCTEQ